MGMSAAVADAMRERYRLGVLLGGVMAMRSERYARSNAETSTSPATCPP